MYQDFPEIVFAFIFYLDKWLLECGVASDAWWGQFHKANLTEGANNEVEDS